MNSMTVSGVRFPKGFIHCSVSGHCVPVSGNPHFLLCCSVTEAIREALHFPTIGVCSQIWQHVPTRPSRSWLWTLRLYLCFWEMKTVWNTTQRHWEVESYRFKGWFLLLNLDQQHRLMGTLPSEAQHFLFVHSLSLRSYLPLHVIHFTTRPEGPTIFTLPWVTDCTEPPELWRNRNIRQLLLLQVLSSLQQLHVPGAARRSRLMYTHHRRPASIFVPAQEQEEGSSTKCRMQYSPHTLKLMQTFQIWKSWFPLNRVFWTQNRRTLL